MYMTDGEHNWRVTLLTNFEGISDVSDLLWRENLQTNFDGDIFLTLIDLEGDLL